MIATSLRHAVRFRAARGVLRVLCVLALAAPSGTSPAVATDEKAITVASAVRDLPADLKTPDRHALIIGAGAFLDDRIPGLPPCARDARALHRVLTDASAGLFPPGNVTMLLDDRATQVNVKDALDRLARRVGKNDLVVVFFSGHGAADQRDRSYWVMHDTRIDKLRATALPESDITELLAQIRTTRLVTFIDACFSAATANLKPTKSLVDLARIYPQFSGAGRVLISASAGDQLSLVINDEEHPGRGHSAFTWHLVEGLGGAGDANADGVVTVSEVWGYVKDRTELTSRREGGNQQPQFKGQIGSRFLLTVSEHNLLERARQKQASTSMTQQRVQTLIDLLSEKKITAQQFSDGRRLLEEVEANLSDVQKGRRQAYCDLADGKLRPDYLDSVLSSISPMPAPPAPPPTDAAPPPAAPVRPATFTNWVGMRMIYIAPGSFQMGSSLSAQEVERRFGGEVKWYEDEHPRHAARLTSGFHMASHEVTRGQFARFVAAADYKTEAETGDGAYRWVGDEWQKDANTNWRNTGFAQTDDHPVVCVSWNDATAFCRWLGRQEGREYRLPTEAEWEFACRAAGQSVFPWGDDPDAGAGWANAADQAAKRVFSNWAVFNWDDGHVYTAPVGSFRANAWGLHDMTGNVSEWCADWYGNYPAGAVIDPTGSPSGQSRVLRGGSWFHDPWYCRAAARRGGAPGYRCDLIGFRVVCSVRPGFAR